MSSALGRRKPFLSKGELLPRESEPHCEPHPPFPLARYFYFLQESWEREPDRAKGKRQKEGNKCNEKMDKYGREWNPKEPSLVHPSFFFSFCFFSPVHLTQHSLRPLGLEEMERKRM